MLIYKPQTIEFSYLYISQLNAIDWEPHPVAVHPHYEFYIHGRLLGHKGRDYFERIQTPNSSALWARLCQGWP